MVFLKKTRVLLQCLSAFDHLLVPKLRAKGSEIVAKRNAQGSRELFHFKIGPYISFLLEREYHSEVGHDILSSEKSD